MQFLLYRSKRTYDGFSDPSMHFLKKISVGNIVNTDINVGGK